MTRKQPRQREITLQQLRQGYYVLRRSNLRWADEPADEPIPRLEHRDYIVISKTGRGTYIVIDPDDEQLGYVFPEGH